MEYNKLGQTDIEVSKICLGTMTWGEQNTEDEAHEQLNYAMDAVINFIDVAEMYPVPPRKETYGLTESYIGNWLNKRKDRDKIVLATGPTVLKMSYSMASLNSGSKSSSPPVMVLMTCGI